MGLKCDFCNKVFETKQTLIRHQKTAKFCLKIQNKDNDIHSDKTHESLKENCSKDTDKVDRAKDKNHLIDIT